MAVKPGGVDGTQPNDVLMTLAEFLDWDDGTDTIYELIDGQLFAMTSPHWKHAEIVGQLGGLIRTRSHDRAGSFWVAAWCRWRPATPGSSPTSR